MPKKLKKDDLELAGGYSVAELKALRRLERSLVADGYDVGRVALAAGGKPAALVYLGKGRDPFRSMVVAARSFLRFSEKLSADDELSVDHDDMVAVERLRSAARRVSDVIVPRPPQTVGEVLDVDLSRLAKENNDAED